MRLTGGQPLVTLAGDGPPVEINITGTAFVIDLGVFLSPIATSRGPGNTSHRCPTSRRWGSSP
jgi:hypothetical protein